MTTPANASKFRLKGLLFLALGLSWDGSGAEPEAEHAHRFYDFAPVSATNPVVARIDANIDLPASEYVAFRKIVAPGASDGGLVQVEKRASLDELIGDYLLVEEACRIGADQQAGFINRMRSTETILLSELLTAQEVEAKAKTDDEYEKRLQEFNERLFEAAEIVVSNEAYDKLKDAAKRIDAINETSAEEYPSNFAGRPSRARIGEIIGNLDNSVLARYDSGPLTVKEVLAVYAQLREPKPRLEIKEELIKLIKPFVLSGLMAAEARKRGMDKLPEFRNRMEQNRNVLLRMHMRGLIQVQAAEALKMPDYSQPVKKWYQQHWQRYSDVGTTTMAAFELVRARVEGDYSVELRDRMLREKILELRNTHRVEVNEALLDEL